MRERSLYTTIGDTLLFSGRRPQRAIFVRVVRSYALIVGLFVTAIVLASTYQYTPQITVLWIAAYWLYKVVRPYAFKDRLEDTSKRSFLIQLVRFISLMLFASVLIIHVETQTDYLRDNGASNTLWLLYILPIFIAIQYAHIRLMWTTMSLCGVALLVITFFSAIRWDVPLVLNFATDILWLAFLAFTLYVLTRFVNDRSANMGLVHTIQQEIMDMHPTTDELSIWNAAVAKIAENFSYPHVHIFELRKDGTLCCITGASQAGRLLAQEQFVILTDTNSIIRHVVTTGEPYYSNDVRADRYYLNHKAYHDTRSELAVPIMIGTQLVAVLDIQDCRRDIFLDQDIEVMEILANHLGWVLHNIRLVRSLQQSIDSITRLQQIIEPMARRFLSQAELESTLQEIAQAAYEELKADLIVLFEHSPLTGKITLGTQFGELNHPERFNESVERTQTLIGQILLAKNDYYFQQRMCDQATAIPFISDEGADALMESSFVEREGIVSRATLRLRAENNYVGVMILNYRSLRTFDEQDRKLFSLFANLAALAIQKAQAQQQQIQFEREELAWHLHEQITKVAIVTELSSALLDDPQLTDSQATKLAIVYDASQELHKELRFVHDTWKHTPSDDLHSEIEKIVERAKQVYGLDLSVEWLDAGTRLPPAAVHQLRLIVNEAIHNTVSHSRATHGQIRCITSDTAINLTIVDNGRGFDMERIAPRGLQHLQQRAKRLGGTCSIRSAPGRGTHIHTEIPLR